MGKHSVYSASGSDKWLACADHLNAVKGFKYESSIYADEGTACHELFETCITAGQETGIPDDPFNHIGKVIKVDNNSFTVDEEMAGGVQTLLNYIRSINVSPDVIYFCEQKVQYTDLAPNGFGTADFIFYDPQTNHAHIIDLKYGKNVGVWAKDNSQLMLYGYGVMNSLREQGHYITDFTLHIVQPRFEGGHIDSWSLTMEEMQNFAEFVKERVALSQAENPERTAGDHCRFCKANGDCPAFLKHIGQEAGIDFGELLSADPDSLTDDAKVTLLKAKKPIETLIKAIDKGLFDRLEKGEKIDGIKLVLSNRQSVWKNEAKNELVAKFGSQVLEEPKLKGLADIKAIAGDDKDIVTTMREKPNGYPVLAFEDDKREVFDVTSGFEKEPENKT